MKKIILSLVLFAAFALGTQAQSMSKNAIGLRLVQDDGPGIDASYQRAIFKNNRLEFDLGLRDRTNVDAVKFAALFQWVWKIDRGLNWYVGAGGGLGNYDHKNNDYYYYYGNPYYDNRNGTFAFLAGDIGLEYDFNIPLMISLDVRPELGSDGYFHGDPGADIGLAVRYQF